MKRSLSILAILGLASGASGMEIRFHLQAFGGAASSHYSEIPSVLTIPEVSVAAHHRLGPAAGLGAGLTLPLADVLYYVASFEYVQKGTAVGYYYWNDLTGSDVYKLDELCHSSLLKLKPLRRLSPYFLAGYSFSFILGHKMRRSHDPANTIDLTGDTLRRDNGAVVGWGLEFEGRRWGVFVEHRHYYGQSNLSKGTGGLEEYPYFQSRSDIFVAGIRYRVGGRKS